jgi:predicted branched-subunit amino acid permease
MSTVTSAQPDARARPRPVRDGVGLGLAVGVSGVAFGAAAVSSGLSAWQACALSVLAFTGASQFALAGVIASGGGLLAGTAGAILLGSRNSLYGLRLADVLRPRGPRRLLAALGGSDSRMVAYSVVSAEDMDSALALARDCPVMRAGGGVEVGPVMEVAGS